MADRSTVHNAYLGLAFVGISVTPTWLLTAYQVADDRARSDFWGWDRVPAFIPLAVGVLLLFAVVLDWPLPGLARPAEQGRPSGGSVDEARVPLEVRPEPERPATSEPKDIDRSPEDLWGLFVGLTNLQAASVVLPFLGHRMTLSGPVSFVGAWRDSFLQVTIRRSFRDQTHVVFLLFTDYSWIDRLSLLKEGDQIAVRGQIDRIERYDIQLTDCEIVGDE